MRKTESAKGLSVQAVAGTHAVLLGFDLDGLDGTPPPSDLLGFAVRRTDHTEDERAWLRGLKVFGSVVQSPAPGDNYSLRRHPIQGFQWGDYTAKPDHTYTYRVAALHGRPATPAIGGWVDVTVTTEAEDNGVHGVWFNRGVAASQAWNRRFGDPAVELADPRSSAWAWLSRGLGESLLHLCDRATDGRWSLRGAFYELTWADGLAAFTRARDRGVDVQLVVHGRDKDRVGGPGADGGEPKDDDHTAAANAAAVAAAGADGLVTWRKAPNKSSLQHNKFLILLHDDEPVAVWTGSTNLTLGGVYGHANVAHLVSDPVVAADYLAYWRQLRADTATGGLRQRNEHDNPVGGGPAPAPPPAPVGAVFSPRATSSHLLDGYAARFDAARSSAHITGAFGLHKIFRNLLSNPRPLPRTVLLDKRPGGEQRIGTDDENVRVVWGGHLTQGLGQWAAERLTGFNGHVPYIHLKVILVDPLTDTPVVITGSANYSDNSTFDNDENTLVLAPTGTSPAFEPAEVARVADIYLTEYERIFSHHVFRAFTDPDPSAVSTAGRFLAEDASWVERYRHGWRATQRHLFAGTRP